MPLRSWAAQRPTLDRDGSVWLSLLVAALLLAGVGTPRSTQVFCLFLVVGTLFLSLRFRIGPAAIVVLLVVGVLMRSAFVGFGQSDVLSVTGMAIEHALAGGNPYGVGYPGPSSTGAPFAYGPLALLWYLPSSDPRSVEMGVSLLILVVLAVRGRPLGMALYAVSTVLLVTASDGSNDTSAGLFLLVALLAAGRSPLAGGALLALAVAFKPYALAWLPPLLVFWGPGVALVGFAVIVLATWGPVLLIWGPGAVLTSLRMADAVHARAYYSLAYGLTTDPAWRPVLEALRFAAGGLLAALSWLVVRSPVSLILWGAAIFLVTLFMGYWATFAYLAALAPVLCWHLDEWLGLGEGRVRWPADPVGRLTGWVDARWPVRDTVPGRSI
ncbi:MAG: hypothetical protein M3472_07840, partial [Chloroflexota bacterium]|nr:hypothetical protein [Chloroflexota bacterium]